MKKGTKVRLRRRTLKWYLEHLYEVYTVGGKFDTNYTDEFATLGYHYATKKPLIGVIGRQGSDDRTFRVDFDGFEGYFTIDELKEI